MKFKPEKLKQCRHEKGISQEMAVFGLLKEGLKITRNTLIKWESGETSPGVDNMPAICFFYGKPITYFFGLKCPKTAFVGSNGRKRAVRSNKPNE